MTVFTCKQSVGLGPQVDVVPPGGKITYPDAGETPIKGSFVLKGTAKDDDGVESVSVVFENIETKERTPSYSALLFNSEPGRVNWEISINNKSTGTEPEHPLVKLYPIPDGEYTAIVTVTDKGGKTYETRRNYKIDNTPPVFIVSRPSTYIKSGETGKPADGYGAVFSVVGEAGERNIVEKLKLDVSGKTLNDSNFVGNTINAQVAVYGAFNNGLYELQTENPASPISGKLYLYDNAREYRGGEPLGEGNKSAWYYMKDAISKDVLGKGFTATVIRDYFAGKKGSDKNDHEKKIKELRGNKTALKILKENMIKMDPKDSAEQMYSIFKLDPSKSPGFKVIGVKNLPDTDAKPSSKYFRVGETETFFVQLIRNKDKTPLVEANELEKYKKSNIEIVLLKWKGTGDAAYDFKNGKNLEEKSLVKFSTLTDTSLITVEGENLRVKCSFDPSWGEGLYAVKVKGRDIIDEASHDFKEYDDSNSVNGGWYIVDFKESGNGPRVRPRRPEGLKNKNFEIRADVEGLKDGDNVYYVVKKKEDKYKGIPDEDPYPSTKLEKVSGIVPAPEPPIYHDTVDINSLSDGEYEIHFLAKTSGAKDADKTYFTVDKTAPTVDLSFPEPTDPWAGVITVSGTISDAGAGVNPEKTKYILGKKTPITTPATSGWKAMDSSTKGSWSVRVNLDQVPPSEYGTAVGAYNEIPLYILTEDEIGNKGVKELKILFNPDGTKPVVKVLSPQQTTPTTTLGGTIQIFGTASAVIGGPGAVGEVYIQFSRNGSFDAAADGTFGSKNWYNNGDGQPVPGTVTGGADWRISINSDSSFNHPTNQNQDVYFRVRAKNKTNGRLGQWTTPIKIIVDKSAPTIGSPNAVKVDDASSSAPQGSANAKDYTPNMWIGHGKKLIGSLHDDSGIKAVQIKSSGLAGGVDYDLATAQAQDWIKSVAGGNYELNIPLELNTLSQSAKDAGEFSVNISITEDTASPAFSTQQTFMFRFDTANPVGDYGTDKHMNIGNFTSSSITDAQLAQKVRDLGGTNSEGGGCKIVAGNSVLTVTKVTGNTVEFTASPTLIGGSYSYILYKPESLIYESSSGDWIINGVANDSGSGVKEVKAKVSVNGVFSPEIRMTETDPQNRITKQLGTTVTWQGKIDLDGIPDGKGKLSYTITDKSGNTYSHEVDVQVKNKPIKVSAVTLSTDIGGTSSTFENGLKGKLNDDNRNFEGSVTSTEFAFKNKDNSKIKVNFTGGQGTVKYRLKKGSSVIGTHNLKPIPSSKEIVLTESDLNQIGNSNGTPTEIILELWDEAHGFTVGTNTAFAKITIKTLFDAIDNNSPTVVVLPFHWNGEDDNSRYQNSREKGHVEIAKFDGSSNNFSSVSGKVRLRGFAYDNIKIDVVTAVLPHKTLTAVRPNSGAWTTGSMATDGAVLTVEKLGADYLGYYVQWTLDWDTEKTSVGLAKNITVSVNDGTNTSNAADGGTVQNKTVTRQTLKTAEHSDFADKKPGQFVVFKKGEKQYLTRIKSVTGNTVTLEDSVPLEATDASMYGYTANKANISVNIVPYITGITTGLSESGGNDPDLYARTALGRYPVRDGETIKIHGFNLAGAVYTVGGVVIPTTNVTGTASPWALELPAFVSAADKGAISGKLIAQVNSIETINNKNNNAKDYNKAKETANNNKLTDDVELDVWQFNSEAALPVRGTIAEPVMRINPANGMIGFAFANGPDYFSMSEGTVNSYVIWHRNTDDFRHIDFIYDKNGVSHGVVTAQDQNSQSEHASNLAYITSKWGHPGNPQGGSNYAGNNALRLEKIGQDGKMDGSGGNILDKNRIENPSLVAANDSGTDTRIYLAYYDGINDQIRFKAGTLTAAMNWTYMKTGKYKKNDDSTSNVNIEDWRVWKKVTIPDPDPTKPPRVVEYKAKLPIKPFGQFVDQEWRKEVQKYNQDNVSIVAGKYMKDGAIKDTNNKTGRYLSLGVVPGPDASKDVAVLIWFDERSKKLKYTYNKYPAKEDASGSTAPNPPPGMIDPSGDPEIQDLKFDRPTIPPRHFGSQTPGSSTPDGYWTTVKNVFKDANIGEYCKMVVDKNGGIHIAAYNFATASLHYAYLSKYDDTGTFKTSVVDSYGITGSDIRLDVAMSASGKPIPYIGYYSASAGCAKLAYLVEPDSGFDQGAAGVESGYFTGKWEVTCIPTESRIEKDNINVAVWKDPGTGKIKPSVTGPNSSNTTSGKVYGNGTSNPVLGYAIRKATEGYIETAQKK